MPAAENRSAKPLEPDATVLPVRDLRRLLASELLALEAAISDHTNSHIFVATDEVMGLADVRDLTNQLREEWGRLS